MDSDQKAQKTKLNLLSRYDLEAMKGKHLEELRHWYAMSGNKPMLEDVLTEQKRRQAGGKRRQI